MRSRGERAPFSDVCDSRLRPPGCWRAPSTGRRRRRGRAGRRGVWPRRWRRAWRSGQSQRRPERGSCPSPRRRRSESNKKAITTAIKCILWCYGSHTSYDILAKLTTLPNASVPMKIKATRPICIFVCFAWDSKRNRKLELMQLNLRVLSCQEYLDSLKCSSVSFFYRLKLALFFLLPCMHMFLKIFFLLPWVAIPRTWMFHWRRDLASCGGLASRTCASGRGASRSWRRGRRCRPGPWRPGPRPCWSSRWVGWPWSRTRPEIAHWKTAVLNWERLNLKLCILCEPFGRKEAEFSMYTRKAENTFLYDGYVWQSSESVKCTRVNSANATQFTGKNFFSSFTGWQTIYVVKKIFAAGIKH